MNQELGQEFTDYESGAIQSVLTIETALCHFVKHQKKG